MATWSAEREAETDEWLVTHALGGSLAAYEALVRRHQDRVYRIAYRMLGNAEDAQDVAQDVLLQVWVSLASFVGSAAFSTWLYRVTINKAVTMSRRRYRHVERTGVEDVAAGGAQPQPSSEASVLAGERSAAIASALASLNPELRSAFVLRHFENLSYQQIAAVLKITEPTVRGRLARARQQLTAELRGWR